MDSLIKMHPIQSLGGLATFCLIFVMFILVVYLLFWDMLPFTQAHKRKLERQRAKDWWY